MGFLRGSMFGIKRSIGIDLGTANTLVYYKQKEKIVLNEPSVVAIHKDTKKVLAVGKEARDMIGKTPDSIIAVRPLKEGVIADYDITAAMIKHFVKKILGEFPIFLPEIMICVPIEVTGVERRAVREAAMEAGAKDVHTIEEARAAALGAGIDITAPEGSMIVDIGGGTSEIAVISLGGIVKTNSLRIAGDKLDEAIVQYVRKNHNLIIGEKSAEEIKMSIARAYFEKDKDEEYNSEIYEVRGRNILNGLPRNIKITSKEVYEAIEEHIYQIIEEIKIILEKTPPELSADIYQKGLVLAGGGALIKGLDRKISEELKIPVTVAEDPLKCVVNGIGKLLEEFEVYNDVIISPETDY